MADIVNLNKFRKDKAKDAARQKAAENRAAKGQPKHIKSRLQLELEKARRDMENKRLDD